MRGAPIQEDSWGGYSKKPLLIKPMGKAVLQDKPTGAIKAMGNEH